MIIWECRFPIIGQMKYLASIQYSLRLLHIKYDYKQTGVLTQTFNTSVLLHRNSSEFDDKAPISVIAGESISWSVYDRWNLWSMVLPGKEKLVSVKVPAPQVMCWLRSDHVPLWSGKIVQRSESWVEVLLYISFEKLTHRLKVKVSRVFKEMIYVLQAFFIFQDNKRAGSLCLN